jgi:DNA segregation ATPase FtsK/SpoIIIE-like protein
MQTETATELWRANYRHDTLELHYAAAVEAVCAAGYGSTRLLQAHLSIGYHRASILIETMRDAGVLGCDFDNKALRYELLESRGFY